MKFIYGVAITREEGRYVVGVRDLPEVCTDGETRKEALSNAAEAISAVLLAKIDSGDEISLPSEIRNDETGIAPEIRTQLACWLALPRPETLNRIAGLAGTNWGELRKMKDGKKDSSASYIERVGKALGHQVVLEFSPSV